MADEVPDEQRPRFDRLATMADKDNDGAITQEELRQGFDRIRQQFAGKPGEMDPARVFEYLDRNADGKLTADEVPSERKSMFERAVQFGDRDGDGALTEEEFTKVVTAGRQRQQPSGIGSEACCCRTAGQSAFSRCRDGADRLSRLDADHDGKVSFAEFSGAREEAFCSDRREPGRVSGPRRNPAVCRRTSRQNGQRRKPAGRTRKCPVPSPASPQFWRFPAG